MPWQQCSVACGYSILHSRTVPALARCCRRITLRLKWKLVIESGRLRFSSVTSGKRGGGWLTRLAYFCRSQNDSTTLHLTHLSLGASSPSSLPHRIYPVYNLDQYKRGTAQIRTLDTSLIASSVHVKVSSQLARLRPWRVRRSRLKAPRSCRTCSSPLTLHSGSLDSRSPVPSYPLFLQVRHAGIQGDGASRGRAPSGCFSSRPHGRFDRAPAVWRALGAPSRCQDDSAG
jgi:hypothetical protein